MDMDTFFQNFSSVGFPVLVAVFYMFRGSQDQKAMTDALNSLKEAITKMQLTIEQQDKKGD